MQKTLGATEQIPSCHHNRALRWLLSQEKNGAVDCAIHICQTIVTPFII